MWGNSKQEFLVWLTVRLSFTTLISIEKINISSEKEKIFIFLNTVLILFVIFQ